MDTPRKIRRQPSPAWTPRFFDAVIAVAAFALVWAMLGERIPTSERTSADSSEETAEPNVERATSDYLTQLGEVMAATGQ